MRFQKQKQSGINKQLFLSSFVNISRTKLQNNHRIVTEYFQAEINRNKNKSLARQHAFGDMPCGFNI